MTTTWRTTVGAALMTTALCVAGPLPAQTQQVPPPQRPVGGTTLPPLPATQLDERLPATARSGQSFSLSFSEPQPIRDVLLLMLKDTGLSVAIDPDVTGTFTGELANVTLKQGLDITLRPLGLQYTLDNNVLHVFRRPTDTRFFSVDYLAGRRSGVRTTTVQTGIAAITSSDATDFYEEVSRAVGALLSSDGSFTVDRKAGLVRVTDYPDRLERVSHYLELAELRATRQVQIQVTFVEVTLTDAASAGIDWTQVLTSAGEAVAPVRRGTSDDIAPASIPRLVVRNFAGLLRALATQGSVNVLAAPGVSTLNNEPAIVRAGTQRSAVTSGSAPDAAGRRQSRVSRPQADDGVVLTVTPQISADGIIQMSVAPTLVRGEGRGADTVVRMREGETVVIGGMMQAPPTHDRPKARGLAGVPVLGSLFHGHAKPAAGKTELVILLTPTIL